MTSRHAWGWTGVLMVLLGAALSADTLYLRDGRRVEGQLIGIRDGVVDFEEQRGLFGRERVRVDLDDVVRIEFDRYNRPPDRDRDRDRDDRDRDDRGGPATRPPGMRERSIAVNASEPWRDTGIVVRAGQTLYFQASGRVRWGPGRQDGPDGERNSPRNDGRPVPNRPAAALIGRVGETNDYFFIGDDTGAIRMRGNGRLYLGINDDYLRDNSGSFRVTVYY